MATQFETVITNRTSTPRTVVVAIAVTGASITIGAVADVVAAVTPNPDSVREGHAHGQRLRRASFIAH